MEQMSHPSLHLDAHTPEYLVSLGRRHCLGETLIPGLLSEASPMRRIIGSIFIACGSG